MAAVTVDRERRNVVGDLRLISATVDVASDTDTYDTKLAIIESVSAISETNNAIGCTISGGVITFQTGGAENNVLVSVVGR